MYMEQSAASAAEEADKAAADAAAAAEEAARIEQEAAEIQAAAQAAELEAIQAAREAQSEKDKAEADRLRLEAENLKAAAALADKERLAKEADAALKRLELEEKKIAAEAAAQKEKARLEAELKHRKIAEAKAAMLKIEQARVAAEVKKAKELADALNAAVVIGGDAFTFHQGKDSSGNDLRRIGGNSAALIAACKADAKCCGFNTNGWIKGLIKPNSTWGTWAPASQPSKGLYVKKSCASNSAGNRVPVGVWRKGSIGISSKQKWGELFTYKCKSKTGADCVYPKDVWVCADQAAARKSQGHKFVSAYRQGTDQVACRFYDDDGVAGQKVHDGDIVDIENTDYTGSLHYVVP